MDGGAPWWPEVAAWCGPAHDGAGSRGGEPVAPSPPVSVSPGGETQKVLWVRPRDRVGSRVAGNGGRARVTRTAGLGHAEVGSPASPWLLGARGRAPSA